MVIINFLVHLAAYCLLTLIIYLPIRLIYLNRKKAKVDIPHEIILALLICWTVGILSQTVFPMVYLETYKSLEIIMIFPSANTLTISSSGFEYINLNKIVRTINLVPFRTIFEYLSATDSNGFFSESSWQILGIANLLGNFLLFVPFGFLLPLDSKRFQKLKNTLLAGAVFVFLIEFTQYFMGRAADIDDFIVNVLGVLFGYLAYFILMKIIERVKTK